MLPCNENKRYLYQAIAFNNYQAIVSSLYFKILWVYGINTMEGEQKHTPTNIGWNSFYRLYLKSAFGISALLNILNGIGTHSDCGCMLLKVYYRRGVEYE